MRMLARSLQLLPLTIRLGPLAERGEKLLTGSESTDPLSGPIGVGIALASLPVSRPEPRLRGINEFLWSQENSFSCDLSIQEITLLQVRGAAHVVRECYLTFGSHGGSRHDSKRIIGK